MRLSDETDAMPASNTRSQNGGGPFRSRGASTVAISVARIVDTGDSLGRKKKRAGEREKERGEKND